VDFHLERGLRLDIETEYKSLYTWAINEIDGNGKQVGRDQIPWPWTLHFTATKCFLNEDLDIGIETPFPGKGEDTVATPTNETRKVTQGSVIRTTLRPGRPWRDGRRSPTFSMFGTDRVIKSFELDIYPITDPARQESCTTWGSVSYTTEIDFRNETTDDCIVFYLFVKPGTFARYAQMIAHGSMDEMVLSVGSVAGFYSEWSPSISTDSVKVLTAGNEQNVSLPSGIELKPPRLGDVADAKLYISRRLEFGTQAPEATAPDDEIDNGGLERPVAEIETRAITDPRMLQVMGSLRRAAWLVVWIVALIFIVTLLK
jgi:hypothetical protein